MASTVALFTGLSGLNANSRSIEVTGNNISNVNTTAYKNNRLAFETQIVRTMGIGSEPNGEYGGTNPTQVGLGVRVAGTQRDFRTGSISPTGDARDLAIDGKGLFIVEQGGEQLYTRAGNFRPNAENELVTIDGARLLGWGVDDEFNVVQGTLGAVSIPIGTLTLAEATSEVRISGNLDADGLLPTGGSETTLGGPSGGLTLVSTATPPSAGNLIETTSLLTEVEDPLLPGSDAPLFTAGQSVEVTGVEKGDGTLLPTRSFLIDAASTLQDLADFLTEAFGIQSTGSANPDGNTPGVAVDPAAGTFVVHGNTGTVNDLVIEAADIRLEDPAGNLVRLPLSVDKQASADGESVRTSFAVFDSLGSPVTVDLTMALESRSNSGTSWRYFVESRDDTDVSPGVGTGLLSFDTSGQLVSTSPVTVEIDRDDTGALTPLSFSMFFAGDQDNVTALSDVSSQIGATYRDGAPIGTMSDFGVGPDGVISGSFTNGLSRTIGLIPLAAFTNQEGLVETGSNLYRVGANAGSPVVASPGTFGAGDIVGGALELSNVDLGQEFINLILASTGYSASSRVIQTTDDLLQQLLVLGR